MKSAWVRAGLLGLMGLSSLSVGCGSDAAPDGGGAMTPAMTGDSGLLPMAGTPGGAMPAPAGPLTPPVGSPTASGSAMPPMSGGDVTPGVPSAATPGGTPTPMAGGTTPATGGDMTPGMTPGMTLTPSAGGDTSCCMGGDCNCLGGEPTAESLRAMGPFQVEKYVDGFPQGTGYLAGTIYYPSDAEGPLSVITLCPGWTATQDSDGSVGPWGPFLASHGFVVMTLDTLTTLDFVEQRDEQIMAAMNAVKGENTRSGSPLEGRLSGRFGVGGWSMGGGGTWIVAATEPEVKTAMSLAGHHSTVAGFVQTYATKINIPTIIFAGEADIPPLGNRPQNQEIYDGIPQTTPKILYEMTGLGHFEFGTPLMTNMGYLGAYGLAFQKTYLEGDVRYKQFLLTEGPNASDWRSNIVE